MNPGEPTDRFTVRLTHEARESVLALLARAQRFGVRARFEAALLEIESALTTDPVGWGEPQRRYRAAHLTVYHRIHDELHVVYAVHDEAKLVWVSAVEPVLGHPLRVVTE